MHICKPFRVRYCETDKMGIVYHGNYYPWFEIGRTEYLRDLGLTYKAMEEQGILLPLIENHCKYRIPAVYDDEIFVRTTVKELTVARVVFSYQLYKLEEDGVLLAEGETAHAFTNTSNRPVNIRKLAPELFDKLKSCMEKAEG